MIRLDYDSITELEDGDCCLIQSEIADIHGRFNVIRNPGNDPVVELRHGVFYPIKELLTGYAKADIQLYEPQDRVVKWRDRYSRVGINTGLADCNYRPIKTGDIVGGFINGGALVGVVFMYMNKPVLVLCSTSEYYTMLTERDMRNVFIIIAYDEVRDAPAVYNQFDIAGHFEEAL